MRAAEPGERNQASAQKRTRARGRKQEFAIVIGNTTMWGKKASHYMLATEAGAFICIETHVKSGAALRKAQALCNRSGWAMHCAPAE